MNFQALKSVQLGNVGERIVDAYLASKEVIPYAPAVGGAHPFDRLCAYKKQRIFIAETKTKPRRIKYPDTGIDRRHFDDYMRVEQAHSLDVWIFFVDSDAAQVYGNKLKELRAPTLINHGGKKIEYPLKWGEMIYFPLANMKLVTELTEEQVAQLRALSGRAKCYEQLQAELRHSGP